MTAPAPRRRRASLRPRSDAVGGPAELPPPPAQAPAHVHSRADLRALQRLMAHALYRPLGPDNRLARAWPDGRRTADIAAALMKPNTRLTSVDRLEIYARCYWFRLIDSVYEDCPGLRALLGERRFAALVRAFLAKYPSRSFTLRNLCARLPQFILETPRLTAPHTKVAHAIARFEWAQTHAFDAAELPPLTPQELVRARPERLRLGLQPHLSLLAFAWPVDDFVIAVKQRETQRAEMSNTAVGGAHRRLKRVPRPARQRTYVVVHRYKHRLYYKRTTAAGFAILSALAAGQPLARALAAARGASPDEIRDWFATWMELGWFCRRSRPMRD